MKTKEYSYFALRVLLGLLFIVPGITKLFVFKAAGVSGMLEGIVLFAWAPLFWAWVLILSETVFGLSLLAGWKVKYTAWPLVIVLAVALIFVVFSGPQINWINILFHLVAIAGLAHISFNGAGAWSVDRMKQSTGAM